jgi:hypothetical protein
MLKRDVSWREIFPHKHASGSREVDGTMIKMMWLPDPLGTITEQLRGPVQVFSPIIMKIRYPPMALLSWFLF